MHAGHTIKITIKHTKKEYNTLSRIVETSPLIRTEKSLITIRRIGSWMHIIIIEFIPKNSSTVLDLIICAISMTATDPLTAAIINRTTFPYITDAIPVTPFHKATGILMDNETIANHIFKYSERPFRFSKYEYI